jgi:hypothetical protein
MSALNHSPPILGLPSLTRTISLFTGSVAIMESPVGTIRFANR